MGDLDENEALFLSPQEIKEIGVALNELLLKLKLDESNNSYHLTLTSDECDDLWYLHAKIT